MTVAAANTEIGWSKPAMSMRVLRWQRRAFGLAAALALALPATGCMTTEQTAAQASSSLPASDLAAIRYFADSPPSDLVPKRRAGDRHTVLALSGGGPDGAYGVGALAGWSNAGTRPAFDVVTGVSTGALMAPFAFLGRDYDELIAGLYTGPKIAGLLNGGVGNLVWQPGLYRHEPLRALIDEHVTDELLVRIAGEHRKGRRLLIATSSLDAQRVTVWNLGALAASERPDRLTLFRDVLTAAISVPVLFPPVPLPGARPNELHADAGVLRGFYSGLELFPGEGRGCASRRQPCALYVIIHNKLYPEAREIPASIGTIGSWAVASIIKSNLMLALETAQQKSRENGIRFGMAYLDTDRPGVSPIDFDIPYMQAMYALGHDRARRPDFWRGTLLPPKGPAPAAAPVAPPVSAAPLLAHDPARSAALAP
jgi:hypothetical protein